MRALFLTLVILVQWYCLFGQSDEGTKSTPTPKITISGYVVDQITGEKLIGAAVFDPQTMQGTVTNNYGFYSLSFPVGSVRLRVSYLGYVAQSFIVDLQSEKTFNIRLSPQNDLQTVEVTAKREETSQSQMSMISIPIGQIKSLPRFMGETDVLKALQLMPGIKMGSEGNSGFYVRGGSPDQNLILLDGMPLYNVSHLFGFMSVFNGEAIHTVNISKGGFPAHHGGRLSSVLEINTKDGNQFERKGNVNMGLLATSFNIEGPVKKGKSSIVFAGRRTYVDALTRPIVYNLSKGKVEAGYFFHDLNTKYTHNLDNGDKIYGSFYYGLDKFYFINKDPKNKVKANLQWGNLLAVGKWIHKHNGKLMGNYSLGFSRYHFSTRTDFRFQEDNERQTVFEALYQSVVSDLTLKADYDYYRSNAHFVKFGSWLTQHRYKPGVTATRLEETDNGAKSQSPTILPIGAQEFAAYVEDDWSLSTRIKINLGLHGSGFISEANYFSLQPRLSGRYYLSRNTSIMASYARMAQYVNLLVNGGIGLPTDLWVPATQKLPAQRSEQWAAGFYWDLPSDFALSVEGYYKTMDNLVEYKDGASFVNSNKRFDELVTVGRGWSYGTELLVQRKIGKTTGWIGYTLSYTNRQFPEISNNRVFPFRYDRRHDLSFVLVHKFNDRFDASVTWVFASGNAITIPVGLTPLSPDVQRTPFANPATDWALYYGNSRNSSRMGNYHRADVSFNFTKPKKYGNRIWNISIYNAYNRMNPFFYTLNQSGVSNRYSIRQIPLFPILPSVSYRYEF